MPRRARRPASLGFGTTARAYTPAQIRRGLCKIPRRAWRYALVMTRPGRVSVCEVYYFGRRPGKSPRPEYTYELLRKPVPGEKPWGRGWWALRSDRKALIPPLSGYAYTTLANDRKRQNSLSWKDWRRHVLPDIFGILRVARRVK